MEQLRHIWRFIPYNWVFGLTLILLIGIPRFIIVLDANVSGSYQYVSFVFVVMWFVPFIFLTKDGRTQIGIRKPTDYKWLLYAFVIGIVYCAFMFVGMKLLFSDTISNSFVYISKSNAASLAGPDSNKLVIFVIVAFSSMIFSPIGEELLYRGVGHQSFVGQFGERKASYFDSLAFAVTHLAHFGVVYTVGGWTFLFLPAMLWMLGMFILSQLLFVCKQKSGSILGAILGHAGYNLSMMYLIFYHIF